MARGRTPSEEELCRLICSAVERLGDDGSLSKPSSTSRGRPVVTVADVEDSEGELVIPANALVTPAARERAADLGVRLAVAERTSGTVDRAAAERLAAQLAHDLTAGQIEDLAFWCWSEGACADPASMRRIVAAGADRVGITTCAPPIDDAITPLIDHTLLKPEATEEQVRTLCTEALDFGFASVCINPYFVPLAHDLLGASAVRVCTVVGFPLGTSMPETKAGEARLAVDQGATEIDMVMNVGALKSGRDDWVQWDIGRVVEASHPRALVKVILETALLGDAEIVRACEIARQAGADFVKTSTGFGPGGATAHDVALMRKTVGRDMGVKASGGIGSREDAAAMIAAGATRLGASAGVRIARGA